MISSTSNNIVCSSSKWLQKTSDCKKKGGVRPLRLPLNPPLTASVSWEIRQNLTIFFVSFPMKITCEGVFLAKLQTVFYQLQFYQRWTSLAGLFFNIFDKKCRPIILYGYFYWLFSLKLFSEKKSVLLKLPHLNTLLPRLDQSNEIHFAASWWALIIKGRCKRWYTW